MVLEKERVDALMVGEQNENWAHRRLIVELANKAKIPTVYGFREYVELGGLMSNGYQLTELGQRAADVASDILNGANPGDIPISQPMDSLI
jgi:putative tryptophan/tyrosine transport system substrate-binding protein